MFTEFVVEFVDVWIFALYDGGENVGEHLDVFHQLIVDFDVVVEVGRGGRCRRGGGLGC